MSVDEMVEEKLEVEVCGEGKVQVRVLRVVGCPSGRSYAVAEDEFELGIFAIPLLEVVNSDNWVVVIRFFREDCLTELADLLPPFGLQLLDHITSFSSSCFFCRSL